MRVGVLFGGRSAEHEVSIMSATSVIRAVDRTLFEVVPLAINRDGAWLGPTDANALLDDTRAASQRGAIVQASSSPTDIVRTVDVVIPVLHGPLGEDGTVQGLLELLDIPYVGCGVLSSAVGMEKGRMKEALRYHGLPVVDWKSFTRFEWRRDRKQVVATALSIGMPCFVKPSALGSSVGVVKVKHPTDLEDALFRAFAFGERVIVEPAVDAREIEVSVLGNHEPMASVPGEIVPSNEFYDYAAKYLDGKSDLYIPANLTDLETRTVQELAIRAFTAIDASGLARVDFFLERGTGRWFVNELNTMPGFTSISMYPKLWEASGLTYADLITRLIELAIERWNDRRPEPV